MAFSMPPHCYTRFPALNHTDFYPTVRLDAKCLPLEPQRRVCLKRQAHCYAGRYTFCVLDGPPLFSNRLASESIYPVFSYDKAKTLMIGDAPRDRQAAEATGVLFYPIIPQQEDQAWDRLQCESLARFLAGTYAGAYQDLLKADFDQALSDTPFWK